MTHTETALSLAPPRVSEHVLMGPLEYIGGSPMRLAKQRKTGRYLRMGEREAFLLEQLEGQVTPPEIAGGYRERFGRSLSPALWRSALALFEKRGLLHTDAAAPERATGASDAESGSMNPFAGKLYFWNPDSFVGALAPYFAWIINGPAFALWLTAIVVAEGLLWNRFGEVWHDFMGHPVSSFFWRALGIALVRVVVMSAHELGHAVACKRYGGEVREMGFLFRYFTVCAFTRIDDILLFHKRRYRIYALLIGPLISLTTVPVALWVWSHTPVSAAAHTVATDVLIWYNAGSLLQLLPFLQFDGYFMLAQLLRMPDLRKDSYQYLLGYGVAKVSGWNPPAVSKECAGFVVPVYFAYGILSAVVSVTALSALFWQYGKTLLGTLGPIISTLIACWFLGLLAWKVYSVTLPAVRRSYEAMRRENTPAGESV